MEFWDALWNLLCPILFFLCCCVAFYSVFIEPLVSQKREQRMRRVWEETKLQRQSCAAGNDNVDADWSRFCQLLERVGHIPASLLERSDSMSDLDDMGCYFEDIVRETRKEFGVSVSVADVLKRSRTREGDAVDIGSPTCGDVFDVIQDKLKSKGSKATLYHSR